MRSGVRVLGLAWLLLFFINNHNFYFGEGSPGKSAAVNALKELLAYGFAFLLVLIDRRHTRWTDRGAPARHPVYISLFLFPAWSMASQVWGHASGIGIFRCSELVFTAVLTNVTINRARVTPGFLDELVAYLLRWFTWIVVGLMLLGYALGPIYAHVKPTEYRFTWIAAHVDLSGAYMACAMPVLVFARKSLLRIPLPARGLSILLMAYALYKNHSRTAILAALLTVLIGVWLMGRSRHVLRIFGPPYLLGGACLVLLYAYQDVVEYALRGGSSAQLLTLNSRTRVWATLPEKLTTPGRWVIGLGYGASKQAFTDVAAFAGNAHNTVVALLVNLGFVGLLIVLGYFLYALVGMSRTMVRRNPELGVLMLLVLLAITIEGATADAFADPNFGLAFLYLCVGIAVAERPRRDTRLSDL